MKELPTDVNTHHLPAGLGTKEEACSIAAINLGGLTDPVPDCMSPVIGEMFRTLRERYEKATQAKAEDAD